MREMRGERRDEEEVRRDEGSQGSNRVLKVIKIKKGVQFM